MDKRARYEKVFALVRSEADLTGERRKRCYCFAGKQMCKAAFCQLVGCTAKVLRRIAQAVKEGHTAMPNDMRKTPLQRPEPASEDCDAFFMFLYMGLAEPLAIAADQLDEDPGQADQRDKRFQTLSVSEAALESLGQEQLQEWNVLVHLTFDFDL